MLSRSRVYSHIRPSQRVWKANRGDSIGETGSERNVAQLGALTEVVDSGSSLMHGHFWQKKWNLVAPVKTHMSSLMLATVVNATLTLVVLPRCCCRHLRSLSPSIAISCARCWSPITPLSPPWCSPFLTHTVILFLFSSFLFHHSAFLFLFLFSFFFLHNALLFYSRYIL
ncbi:hypothetical protein PHAVU_004G126800 [Phaseolus vulgaris]|uniref:Uncharacterized protein n=1 Tax=Phaseolus vulgaris TaxID=3885 RepID=V7C4T5_PHAVU|nr:hypothetical protein PHAVU_004G126800g [Phaseolus vulgaris]ESW24393.1 hypothetical protein PHAVU_004G126800g [Phaseolus vulgaris]